MPSIPILRLDYVQLKEEQMLMSQWKVAGGYGVIDCHFSVTEARGMRRRQTLMSPSTCRLRQNRNAGRDLRNPWFSLSCFGGKHT